MRRPSMARRLICKYELSANIFHYNSAHKLRQAYAGSDPNSISLSDGLRRGSGRGGDSA